MSAGGNDQLLVLLVDDDADLLELTQLALEHEGMRVVTARDGERALNLLEVIEPDVVVTDMMMPVKDGFALIREYQRSASAAPIIAISALRPYLDEALRLGAAAALSKPYALDQLRETVRATANGRRANSGRAPEAAPVEEARLRAILDLHLDRRAPEQALEDFTTMIAQHFGVPIALISVITPDRQFWTAGCGIPEEYASERGTPRRDSFCTHAVAARAALVVQDTLDNPFFHDNLLVVTKGVRFYAGVPLIARHGEVLGTLCLLDYQPRHFTHADLELLGVFARGVMAALELREKRRQPGIPDSSFRYLHYVDRELDCFGRSAFLDLAVVEGSRGAHSGTPVACVAIAAPARRLREVADELRRLQVSGLIGRLGHARLGWIVPGVSSSDAYRRAVEVVGAFGFVNAIDLDRYPGTMAAALEDVEAPLGDAGLL